MDSLNLYLQEIAKIPLLTAEEEKIFGCTYYYSVLQITKYLQITKIELTRIRIGLLTTKKA